MPAAGTPAAEAATPVPPAGSPGAITFLLSQAAWLRRALERADDPTEVGTALGSHDASHEAWLHLIASVERTAGHDAAQQVAVLYGFHGRVVGSLERGLDLRLDPGVARQIRRILAERLQELTAAAVATITTAASTTAASEAPRRDG